MTAGVRMGHSSDLKALLDDFAAFQPTFILAVPRVFEKIYNSSEAKAEADGKGKIFAGAAAAAVAWSEAQDAGQRPVRPRGAARGVRQAGLRQAARGDGRQGAVRRLRRRTARHPARPLLPRHRRHRSSRATGSPRPPHRPRSTARTQIKIGTRRHATARRRRAHRRRRRDPAAGVNVFRGYRGNDAATAESRARRLVPHRRHRRARRRRLPADHRPQEGDPRHRRRQERRPRGARGPAARPPAGQPVHRRRRRASRSSPR